MRRLILALAAAVTLAGCVSSLQGAYEDRAREECERERRWPDSAGC